MGIQERFEQKSEKLALKFWTPNFDSIDCHNWQKHQIFTFKKLEPAKV